MSALTAGGGEPEEPGSSGSADVGPLATRYDADAAAYGDLWAPVLLPFSRRLVDALPLAGARVVLDLGAGTGALLGEIRRAAPRAVIIAADRSEGMLRRIPAGFPRVVIDARTIPLAAARVDAAVLAFMLFHVPGPGRVLAETRRVLRAGGAVGTTTWDGPPTFAAQMAWFEELDAHGARPIADDPTDHRPLDSPGKVARLLEEAGFEKVRTWTAPFDRRYGRQELIDKLTGMGSAKHRLASLEPGARTEFLRAVRRRLEAMPVEDFVDRATIIFATAVAGAGQKL